MLAKLFAYFRSLNTSWQSIIFVGTVSILFFVIVSQSLSIIQQRYEINKLEEDILQSQNDNKLLVEKIEKTSTEKYVEEIARDKLGMVKSNETPVQVNIVENHQGKDETTKVLNSKDKVGIYLKEWYSQLDEWFSKAKKG